jgi:hypothetical protein
MYDLLHFVVRVKKATGRGALEFGNRHNRQPNSCLLYGYPSSPFKSIARTPPRERIRGTTACIPSVVGHTPTSLSRYKTLTADAPVASGSSVTRIGTYFYFYVITRNHTERKSPRNISEKRCLSDSARRRFVPSPYDTSGICGGRISRSKRLHLRCSRRAS